jgi:hypothetical protein
MVGAKSREDRLKQMRRRAVSVQRLKSEGTVARLQLAEDVLWLLEQLAECERRKRRWRR